MSSGFLSFGIALHGVNAKAGPGEYGAVEVVEEEANDEDDHQDEDNGLGAVHCGGEDLGKAREMLGRDETRFVERGGCGTYELRVEWGS